MVSRSDISAVASAVGTKPAGVRAKRSKPIWDSVWRSIRLTAAAETLSSCAAPLIERVTMTARTTSTCLMDITRRSHLTKC